MEKFQALVVGKSKDSFSVNTQEVTYDDLPKGDVTIRVVYSSVNYKDGLASIPKGGIVNKYPFIPGVDLAGTVISSEDSSFSEGDNIIVTGYELGVSHFGGFSEYARVPSSWVVPLPKGLSLKEAMIYGTAGFTAGLSIQRLEENGIKPESGSILVTGATGGVGSLAVSMLAKRGYHVVASTGKKNEHDFLYKIGAKEIISRKEVSPEIFKPLNKQLWAGAIDPVGGNTLAYILSTMKYGGSVAVSGLTGGTKVGTTVLPFILRGVNLLGIDSVYYPMDKRLQLWDKLSNDFKPDQLSEFIFEEITLEELPKALSGILKSAIRGRILVKI